MWMLFEQIDNFCCPQNSTNTHEGIIIDDLCSTIHLSLSYLYIFNLLNHKFLCKLYSKKIKCQKLVYFRTCFWCSFSWYRHPDHTTFINCIWTPILWLRLSSFSSITWVRRTQAHRSDIVQVNAIQTYCALKKSKIDYQYLDSSILGPCRDLEYYSG